LRPGCDIEATYVEISLYKWELAHGNAHRRIRRRSRNISPGIVKNGQIVEIGIVESGKVPACSIRQRTDP
jgi:hypothetical protein